MWEAAAHACDLVTVQAGNSSICAVKRQVTCLCFLLSLDNGRRQCAIPFQQTVFYHHLGLVFLHHISFDLHCCPITSLVA